MRVLQIYSIFIIFLCSISAHSYSTKQCKRMDWRQKGYDLALDDKPMDEFYEIEKKCLKKEVKSNETAFKDGWNSGKKFSCSDESAFNAGKSDKRALKICSSSNYQELYKKGTAILKLNKELESLASNIKSDQSKISKYSSKLSSLKSSVSRAEEQQAKLEKKKQKLLDDGPSSASED